MKMMEEKKKAERHPYTVAEIKAQRGCWGREGAEKEMRKITCKWTEGRGWQPGERKKEK